MAFNFSFQTSGIYGWRSIVLIGLVLSSITLGVYMQTSHHQFVGLDDDIYVTRNARVASGLSTENVIWAFTSVDTTTGYWLPITWLSHMADVQIFGMNPRGHHLTNVAIHTVSTFLLLVLLFRVTGTVWQSSFVAALFALHPLHVESVAWVAERKDVLSGFFCFITLLLYAEFAAKRSPAVYILALFSFMLGLMSKPMLVTLPIVMLLMDFWPLDRYRDCRLEQEPLHISGKLLEFTLEKLPFFAFSLFSGIVTIYAQRQAGAMSNLYDIPLQLRIENALISYTKYVGKTFWPSDLAVFYPFPLSIPFWQVAVSLLVLLLVTVATIRSWQRRPYLAVGWLWFLITLVPVIGLVQVGVQSMADRFSYIPGIGLFIMAAWGIPDLMKGLQHKKKIIASVFGAVIFASTALTWQQLGYWRDSISLFRHTLNVTTGNYRINNNLGLALASRGEFDAAIHEYQEALRINFKYALAHNNLGLALASKGDLDAAVQEYQEALRIDQNFPDAYSNLGLALFNKGNVDAAIMQYQKALELIPNHTDAHFNLGLALESKGDLDAAIHEYQQALLTGINDPDAHNNLGNAFARKGDLDAAISEFRQALRISPGHILAKTNLAAVLSQKSMQDKRDK